MTDHTIAPTADERAQWRELAEKATGAPWALGWDVWDDGVAEVVGPDAITVADCDDDTDQGYDDARFIAVARDAVPRLLVALEDAEQAHAESEDEVRRWREQWQERNDLIERAMRDEQRRERAEADLAVLRRDLDAGFDVVRQQRDEARAATQRVRAALAKIDPRCEWRSLDATRRALDAPPDAGTTTSPDGGACPHGLTYPHRIARDDGYNFPTIQCPGSPDAGTSDARKDGEG